MAIYLAPFVERYGVFEPDIEGFYDALDFTPFAFDAARQKGPCIVRCDPQRAKPGRLKLVEDPSERLTSTLRGQLGNRLGITIEDQPDLKNVLAHLLLDHGEDSRPGRWNRLRPTGGRYRIYLGEDLWSMPVIAGGATYAETWPGPDSDSPDGDLDWTELVGDWDVVANKLRQMTGGNIFIRAEHDLASPDHYCQADVTWLLATSSVGGTCVRFAPATTTCYRAWGSANADLRNVQRVVDGTITTLSSQPQIVEGGTLSVKTTADGSTISGLVGAESSQVTDTAIPTGTRFGLSANSQAESVEFGLPVAADLGGLSVVGKTHATRWHLKGNVGKTEATRYRVLARVGKAQEARWNTRSVAGRTVMAAWRVLKGVGRSASTVWITKSLAGRTHATGWNQRAATGKTQATRWRTLVSAGRTHGTSWRVLTSVGRTAGAAWRVLQRIGRTVSTLWNTDGVAVDEVEGPTFAELFDHHNHVEVLNPTNYVEVLSSENEVEVAA